ncbi:MAG: hypothetical protein M3384_18490 [Acidobacteriota bacterium]|nr:hypothetical protein [Acidobacteriota bacterium]
MTKITGFLFIFICLCCASAFGCASKSASEYVWNEITKSAAYPQGYGYPVFVMDGEMRALYGEGWISKDGKNWTKANLPSVGLNPAYQKFIQFKDAIYALGTMQGNYLNMKLTSKISRTRDFRSWETLAEKSNLPERVFYGAVVFKDKIWLVGGWDGKNYHNDVWNSEDGVNWRRVAEKTAWTPRTARVIVFKDRLWLIGGGVIDGDKVNNPNAGREVWTSQDGINWTEEKINSPGQIGGTAVVFDEKLWLIGANRNDGRFDSALYVSDDGINWRRQSAPWTPRGAVAAWVFDDKLFMTGGKFSYTEPNGEIKFVYSNDVWAMTRKTE